MTIVIKTAVVHVVHEVYVMMQLSKESFFILLQKDISCFGIIRIQGVQFSCILWTFSEYYS